jgi:hypothetical protein
VILRRRTVALATVVAVLALPAAALAQSAGDNQYNDPFGGKSGSKHSSGGGGGGGGGGGNSSGSSGSGSSAGSSGSGTGTGTSSGSTGSAAGTSSGTTSSSTGTTSGSSGSGQQLARTGSDTWLVALAGGGFLLAGVGLRLRLRGRTE